MGDIVALKRPADPDVVRLLEEALVDARSGNMTGVMLLKQDPEGIAYATAGVEDRFAVLGWLSHAMHRLQTDDA